MKKSKKRVKAINNLGLIVGFLFGTAGFFLIMMFMFYLPYAQIILYPFILPTKLFLWFIKGFAGATFLQFLLAVVLSGVFYGLLGGWLQYLYLNKSKTSS